MLKRSTRLNYIIVKGLITKVVGHLILQNLSTHTYAGFTYRVGIQNKSLPTYVFTKCNELSTVRELNYLLIPIEYGKHYTVLLKK